MLKLLLSLMFSPMLSFSQDTISNTGSNISPEDASAIVAHHNKVRNDLNIPPLTWSTDLAKYAQNWADTLATLHDCTLIHRQSEGANTQGYGENLYGASTSGSFNPLAASEAWYSEIQHYTYAKLDENNWNGTGHYTQMIWKNTKEVGVGIATCPGGKIIVVANYNPPGNYMGEAPY